MYSNYSKFLMPQEYLEVNSLDVRHNFEQAIANIPIVHEPHLELKNVSLPQLA